MSAENNLVIKAGAGKILSSAKDGLFVVDDADGTYLVKR
jgi:hypothetical protein